MEYEDVIKETKERMKKAVEVLKDNFHGMRTGRANPGLVEGVRVDYYGSLTPLKQIAATSAPEANMLVIKPFDPSSLKEIEKAIQKANLGIQPANDGKIIRITIPPLSQERREQLVTQAKKQSEEARVSVRNIRRDGNRKGEQLKKNSDISDDEFEDLKKEIQKLTDGITKEIERMFEKKSGELLTI
jgi:ribosome recycling factor